MESTEVRRVATLVAAVALIVLTAVSSASAEDRSFRASEVEAEVARANLAGQLRAGMGREFAGLWFEPASAEVKVAFASARGRSEAEAIARQAGLADFVTEVPVSSTWAQMQAAQAQWNRRLNDLFARGEVATSLAADRNALEVELGSAVPPARRAALERRAAADEVDVAIAVAPQPSIALQPQKRCGVFKPAAANCERPIVAGVSIRGPKGATEESEGFEELEKEEAEEIEAEPGLEEYEGGKKRASCTAGPAARLRNPGTSAEATETYILTAGHCIGKAYGGGGAGVSWWAFPTAGGEKEIGLAAAFIEDKTDVGAIEVSNSYWALKNPVPVEPTVANWSGSAATDPAPVVLGIPPVEGTNSCLSGQMTSVGCGKIIKTERTIQNKKRGVKIEHLAEVEYKVAQKGDSGGPWFAESQFKKEAPRGYVEGTHVGNNLGTGNAIFEPLEASLPALEKEWGLDLELLTTTNESRHGAVVAGKYPVTILGTSGGTEKFKTEAGTIECAKGSFHAIASEASSTLTVTPEYKECKATFGVAATIEMEGCGYLFHVVEKVSTDNYHAYMDLTCPGGKSIKAVAGTCSIEINPQAERETVDLTDDTTASPKPDITMRPTVTSMSYTVTKDGFLCPFSGTGPKTGLEYTSTANMTLAGQSTTEPSVKIAVEVVG